MTIAHSGAGLAPTQPHCGGPNTLGDKFGECFLCFTRRGLQPIVYTEGRTGNQFCKACTETPGFWRVWGPNARRPMKVGAVEFVPSEQGAGDK